MTVVVAPRFSLASVAGAGVVVAAVTLGAALLAPGTPRAPCDRAFARAAPRPLGHDAVLAAPITAPITAGARVVPALVGGRPIGFRVFDIAPGSLYARLGLEDGDVVTAVDGHDVRDPSRALAVYARLAAHPERIVVVDILRHGQPGTISIDPASLPSMTSSMN